MKTLIFNGSARKNGDTQSLIEELVRQLEGETLIVDAHDVDVKACMDCRYCWEHSECCVKDDWQEIDAYIRDCDNIVIASPVYFCEITGPLLSLLSRLQVYWTAKRFRQEKIVTKPKRGGMILLGGGKGTATAPLNTSAVLLHQMNAKELFDPVCFFRTDIQQPIDNEEIVKDIADFAKFLNRE